MIKNSLLIINILIFSFSCSHEEVENLNNSNEFTPFSFVAIADSHISGNTEHENRLENTIEWINANTEERNIAFVVILGDIAWGEEYLQRAKNLLSTLEIPYIPIIGDNVIQAGNEIAFNNTFNDIYLYLSNIYENFNKAPNPVWNDGLQQDMYLQNFSFDFQGLHIIGLDWCSRRIDSIQGEFANLYDFNGATFSWFKSDIDLAPKENSENIIMFSHHPMHFFIGAFSSEDYNTIENYTAQYADYVYANMAGHYHKSWHEIHEIAGYELFVVDAVWNEPTSLEIVDVNLIDGSFTFSHEIIIIAYLK
ncbi:MAG: metallophosphoesterase [Bacteroidota bacterium]